MEAILEEEQTLRLLLQQAVRGNPCPLGDQVGDVGLPHHHPGVVTA